MIRAARESDFAFLRGFSADPSDGQLRAQIYDDRLRIIESSDGQVGFIKFYVLWEILPFIEVIIVRKDYRRRGIGRQAIRAWEEEMAARSFPRAIISTQADETAQDFWRRVGYRDCGSLALPDRPVELFMYRDISKTAAEHRMEPTRLTCV
jgi:ribosomal protein S18 acetylase RimI-like enzyme